MKQNHKQLGQSQSAEGRGHTTVLWELALLGISAEKSCIWQHIRTSKTVLQMYGYAAEYKTFLQKILGERAPRDAIDKK